MSAAEGIFSPRREKITMKEIFMKTENFGFSVWEKEDFEKMLSLYSEKEISRYITAGGVFSKEQIEEVIYTLLDKWKQEEREGGLADAENTV